MAESKTFLGEEIDKLRELRDELRVQAELGRAELRDRWQELEKSWHQLEGRLEAGPRQRARRHARTCAKRRRLLASELARILRAPAQAALSGSVYEFLDYRVCDAMTPTRCA